MLVYVAFAGALIAANTNSEAESSAATVSPGMVPSDVAIDRHYFRATVEQPRRNDI